MAKTKRTAIQEKHEQLRQKMKELKNRLAQIGEPALQELHAFDKSYNEQDLTLGDFQDDLPLLIEITELRLSFLVLLTVLRQPRLPWDWDMTVSIAQFIHKVGEDSTSPN